MIKTIQTAVVLFLCLAAFGADKISSQKAAPAKAAPPASTPALQATAAQKESAVIAQAGASLQKQLKNISTGIWKAQKSAADVSARLDTVQALLRDTLSHLNRRLQSIQAGSATFRVELDRALASDSIAKNSLARMKSIEKTTRRVFAALTAVILVLFFLVILLMRKIKQAQPLPDLIHSEVQFFFNKLKGILNRSQGGFTPEIDDTRVISPTVKDADHTLPVRVAEEVFRMRLRLSRMPADTKGLAALSNAVNRLEDDLNVKGYFIVDLKDQPYVDEMTLSVREFVPRDDLPAGAKKILRMVRPQVKFQNVIISQGEVEVAMSAEDLAQK
ncbi:MAG: hypothetical protein V1913_09805 [Fibrobacterota bacterium]